MLYFEYNDWQARVFNQSGEILYDDIAAACFVGDKLVFGQAGWEHARTHPQQFNAKYLNSLTVDPLNGAFGDAQNQADLIYQHLLNIEFPANEPVVVGVPGYFSNDQLGLLLGITEQADINVVAFVDSSLVYASETQLSEDIQIIDIELQRLVLTDVAVASNTAKVTTCRNLDGFGLASILDGWMNLIADEFVHKTRFDPTHTGACEQQMQNQLTQWLQSGTPTSRLSVSHNNTTREIELELSDVYDKLHKRLANLTTAKSVALTPRAASVPGLVDLLEARETTVRVLAEALPLAGYQHLSKGISTDEILRIDQVGVTPQTANKADSIVHTGDDPASSRRATHLLLGFEAVSISDPTLANTDIPTDLLIGTKVTINGTSYLAIGVD